jgi:hypothetical protein
MKSQYFPLMSLLVAGSLVVLPAAGLAQVAHSHGSAAIEMSLSLNQGEKWETDEPLRTGMSTIREAFTSVIEDVHAAKLSPEHYARLAEHVETNVNYIVANCKLPEKPDAQLHVIIEHMFEGFEQMKAPDSGQKGAVAIIEALNAYGEHFDHPDWKPLTL